MFETSLKIGRSQGAKRGKSNNCLLPHSRLDSNLLATQEGIATHTGQGGQALCPNKQGTYGWTLMLMVKTAAHTAAVEFVEGALQEVNT